MAEEPEFMGFMSEFEGTANYFVARTQADEAALKLCLAYAFKAGYHAGVESCREY
jgi:hypothetical protein